MPSALVFGAGGQIGQAVCTRLLDAGWQVLGVSRTPRVDAAGIRWLQADLAVGFGITDAVDAVLSCGPLDLFSRWYAGSALAAARVVAFSSTSAAVKQDSPDPAERRLAKLLQDSEASVSASAAQRRAHATVLRPTLVYGAGRDQTLTRIVAIARQMRCFVLPACATGLRQPVHVDDLAAAALAALERPAGQGQVYALPGGESLGYREMVRRTLAVLQPTPRLLVVPTPMFRLALSAAHLTGSMQQASPAVLARMRDDLVFDPGPAQRGLGYAPRAFRPDATMLGG
ncbi:MAG: NAD-dependent epimerase/dehydratase family protein [Pseudoxanthomonas sp.]|nr:NAD-dependent epimerase/dehydratase family protein [Pseudoxanthomonas sp.]